MRTNKEYLEIADELKNKDEARYNQKQNALLSIGITDSNVMGFTIGALESVESQVYKVAHAPKLYTQLIPFDLTIPAGERTVSYGVYDYTGRGKRVNHTSDVRPMANFEIAKVTYDIFEGGMDYSYNYSELMRASRSQVPVDFHKALAAGEGYATHLNEVAIYGDADVPNDEGLITSTVVPQQPSGLAPLGATDPGNLPQDVAAKLCDAVNKVIQDTFENCIPDTVLVDSNVYAFMSRTKTDLGNDQTILSWFLQINPSKMRGVDLKVIPVIGLTDITDPTKTMAVVYKNNADTLVMALPMPFTILPAQYVGTQIKFTGMYQYSNLHIRRRCNMLYLTNF